MTNKFTRRSALKKATYLAGCAVSTPALITILQSCQEAPPALEWQPTFLDEEQARTVTELVEIIIPETDTPGAKQSGVPYFVDQMVGKCLKPEDRSLFLNGLTEVQQLSQEQFGKALSKLSAEEQNHLMQGIAQNDTASTDDNKSPKTFFSLLKELTLIGYFNSELGATKALAYLQIPGSYDGCTDLEPGQKVWAMN